MKAIFTAALLKESTQLAREEDVLLPGIYFGLPLAEYVLGL